MAAYALTAGLETQTSVRHRSLSAKSRMALQAEFGSFTPDQHHAVHAAVRIVTGHAAFNLSCRMLIDERSVLFDMALGAGFRNCPDEIERVGSAMRVVTIRTFHRAFRNAMMDGKRKLRLNRSVTGVTELRLRRLQ